MDSNVSTILKLVIFVVKLSSPICLDVHNYVTKAPDREMTHIISEHDLRSMLSCDKIVSFNQHFPKIDIIDEMKKFYGLDCLRTKLFLESRLS